MMNTEPPIPYVESPEFARNAVLSSAASVFLAFASQDRRFVEFTETLRRKGTAWAEARVGELATAVPADDEEHPNDIAVAGYLFALWVADRPAFLRARKPASTMPRTWVTAPVVRLIEAGKVPVFAGNLDLIVNEWEIASPRTTIHSESCTVVLAGTLLQLALTPEATVVPPVSQPPHLLWEAA